MSRSTNDGEEHFLDANELRVGVFIILDLPWFKHPFTLNSFKIKNSDQIDELRALKLPRYRYDPDRSDVTLIAGEPEPDADENGLPSGIAPDAPAMAEPTAADTKEDDPALAAKGARMRALADRRSHVANVERAFTKAAGVMKNLNRNLQMRPKETLADMGVLVGQMVSAFLESPDVTLHVMGDKVGGEEVYFHSLNVTILAMMLTREMGMSVAEAHDLGIGAMVHDIGLAEIPDRVLKKSPDEYTQAERNLRAQHVEFGADFAKRIGLSPGAMAVVAQHHEYVDGSGYPRGMRGEAMTPAARVVSMVNFYDNLCNPVDVNKAMTPHEALSFMFAQRRAKFDAQVLQLMIKSLGVYPPGSIVQLTGDALGVVTSVNPRKPLRPWVLIYDPKVPKDEAVMLDLEVETNINIAKAIRPSLLPPRVAAYLNPRQRVTYFFDGGDSSRPAA